jgi:hypothetical protein
MKSVFDFMYLRLFDLEGLGAEAGLRKPIKRKHPYDV